jgi:hypothetical protein
MNALMRSFASPTDGVLNVGTLGRGLSRVADAA